MAIKTFLEGLLAEKAPGPTPSFTVFHIMKLLETIAETGSIGRGRLSGKLDLGKGATRTLISRLTDSELISTSKRGCSLTEKGEKTWEEIKAIMPRKAVLGKNELSFTGCSVAVLVKGRGEKIGKGLEQRDAAVRAGAKGAATLVLKDNRLVLPTISTDIKRDYPTTYRQITSSMDLENNDVVIIGFADRLKEAEYGALAAVWTII